MNITGHGHCQAEAAVDIVVDGEGILEEIGVSLGCCGEDIGCDATEVWQGNGVPVGQLVGQQAGDFVAVGGVAVVVCLHPGGVYI